MINFKFYLVVLHSFLLKNGEKFLVYFWIWLLIINLNYFLFSEGEGDADKKEKVEDVENAEPVAS